MKIPYIAVLLLCMTNTVFGVTEQELGKKAVNKYSGFVEEAVWEFGAPASVGFFLAQMRAESTLNENCKPNKWDARGLMQVTRGALKTVQATFPDSVFTDDFCDPRNNIKIGIAYFSYLKFHYKDGGYFNSNAEVLMAYNRGPAGARKHGLHNANKDRYVQKIERYQKYIPAYPYPEK